MAKSKKIKNSDKQKLIYFCLLLIIAVIGMFTEDKLNISNNKIIDGVQVHYIDVGQGDSQLIIDNDKVMLIDGGENNKGKLVANYIKNLNISKIDYIVATHPHSDHIGGLDIVINEIEVENIILPKVTSNTKTFEDLVLSIGQNNVNVIEPVVGDIIEFQNTKFTILGPNSKNYDNLNNYSVSLRMDHEDVSFLFTGDAENLAENEMLNNGLNLDIDVFKVAHHGSNTSNSKKFLTAMTPNIAIISVGADNTYGHPHVEVMDRLEEFTSNVFRTDLDGNVIVISNGKSVSIEKK